MAYAPLESWLPAAFRRPGSARARSRRRAAEEAERDRGEQEAGDPERREAGGERPGEGEARRAEPGHEAPPAGRPEPGRIGLGQPEVAGASRRGQRGGRGGDRRRSASSSAQAGQSATRARASRSSRLRRPARSSTARRAMSIVVVVGAGVSEVQARRLRRPQPRNSSIRSSSRPRRASRPRWIRDFTVPSETPVISAISA